MTAEEGLFSSIELPLHHKGNDASGACHAVMQNKF